MIKSNKIPVSLTSNNLKKRRAAVSLLAKVEVAVVSNKI